MRSWQSHVFRLIIWLSTAQMRRGASVAKMRALTEKGTRFIHPPCGTTVTMVDAAGVPARWIQAAGVPAERVILYIHGGGFTLGWNNQYYGMLTYLSKTSNARILAIDYRLAPEHPFPAALDDCVAAYRWLLQQGIAPQPLAIAGDSAGGNLTLTTMLALRDAGDPLPAASVCLSPGVDFTLPSETSSQKPPNDPVLSPAYIKAATRDYLGGADPYNPLLSPIFADLHSLPPLLIQVGSDELLLHGAQRIAERARAAGVEVALTVWPHMWHVFQLFAPTLPEGRQTINAIGAFISKHVASAVTVAT